MAHSKRINKQNRSVMNKMDSRDLDGEVECRVLGCVVSKNNKIIACLR